MDNYIVKPCPHCDALVFVLVAEINCGIFRHGVARDTMEQMNAHETKANCDEAAARDQIYGCGKPFRAQRRADGGYEFEACDYV